MWLLLGGVLSSHMQPAGPRRSRRGGIGVFYHARVPTRLQTSSTEIGSGDLRGPTFSYAARRRPAFPKVGLCPVTAETEWQTRKRRIDGQLRSAGWEVVSGTSSPPQESRVRHAVEEVPTESGPADYGLYVDGAFVGVIEAKKLSVGPQNVLVQAERYARGAIGTSFQFGEYRLPFVLATNGEVIWYRDLRSPLELSRRVANFPTPDAIRDRLKADFDLSCRWFIDTPNDHRFLRDYQCNANTAVEKAIADRKRQMLVAMATGTGKTFTMVNQIYRLMKSGTARRVLFLVDRRALAAQAVRSFAAFEPEPGLKFDKIYEVYSQRFQQHDFGEDEKFDPQALPNSYLTSPQAGQAFVYVCTIQRMAINLFGRNAAFGLGDEELDDDASELTIPIHAFDIIVADECHRGYTSSELSIWRNTLDHFDAIKIGLTATPAAHTKAYFNDVVFRYEYRQAVEDGHLVDYDAVKVRSNVRLTGLFLKEGEQVQYVNPISGSDQLDLLEDERQYDTSQIERDVTAPESNRKILGELKKYADEHEQQHGRFPKTLIFAVNDLAHTSHADELVKHARDVFGRGESFVQKITGSRSVDRPLQRIREFRNRPEPGIVVTVDMLTTGVDIPDLEFLVFLRPVKSRILFEQMLGRGTRKGEKYPDKSKFIVFDCFDGTLLEYFRKASAFTREPPDKPTRTIGELVDDIWQNRDRDYNIGCIVKRLQRMDKALSGEGRAEFAAFIPEGDLAAYARSLRTKLNSDFVTTMEQLRSSGFQQLLADPPRRARVFLRALEAEDKVSSEWLFRDGKGKEYKPQDYLASFAEYVRNNPDQIEAVRILLDRPQDWGTAALTELRQKLATSALRFSEENLRKAHAAQYHKSLVDIISMVKHAANDTSPLLTAEERVQVAITKLIDGQIMNAEQMQWLDRISAHLLANLSIDRHDFDDIPVFERLGGWNEARRVFRDSFESLISQLNQFLAS